MQFVILRTHLKILCALDNNDEYNFCRHFLFRALDILFSEVVPEVKDTEFQDRLVKMRSKPSFLSLS